MTNYNRATAVVPAFSAILHPLPLAAKPARRRAAGAGLRWPLLNAIEHKFLLTAPRVLANLAPLLQIQESGLTARVQKADTATSAVFLCPQHGNTLYGRCRVGGLTACRFLLSGPSTRTVPPTLFDGRERKNHRTKGVIAMTTPALNPSQDRAARYRALAYSALHADSSLSARLKRYNANMAKARALEAANPAQPVPVAPCPADSGNPAHIQIIQRGNFWHILQGGITRAFAASYRAAQVRAQQLQGGAL